MEDNYALSDAVRQRYERMYTGVFYERYILGLWRMAEGLVYPMFDRSRHVIPDCMPPAGTGTFWVSCDYGTRNPTSIGLWHLTSNGNATRLREYYYDGRKQNPRTDEEHYTALEQLVGTLYPLCGQSLLTRPLLLLWNAFGGTENSGFTRQIILFWTVSGMLARCLL